MPQVTVQPVNANNLQTSLFVHLLAYTSALAHYSMGISSVQDQLTNYEGNWHTKALRKCYCTRAKVSVLARGIKSAFNKF